MTNLVDIFNYRDIISDLNKEISGYLINGFNIDDRLEEFLAFDGKVSENDLSSNILIPNHTRVLNAVATAANACLDPATAALAEKLESEINNHDHLMRSISGLMFSVIQFGERVIPETIKVRDRANRTVEVVSTNTSNIITKGLDSLDCNMIKCIYSPIKNALCRHLLDGMALWTVSGIIFIGAVSLEVAVLIARRVELARTSDDRSEDDDDDRCHYEESCVAMESVV